MTVSRDWLSNTSALAFAALILTAMPAAQAQDAEPTAPAQMQAEEPAAPSDMQEPSADAPTEAQDTQAESPADTQAAETAEPSPGAAEEPNVTEKSADAQPGAIATVELASRLFAHAQENEDPIAMIVAARIRQSAPSTEGTLETEGGATDEPTEAKDTEPAAATAEQMLEAAREAAGDDQAVLALIDEAANTATRGVVRAGDQVFMYTIVDANATDGYRWRDYQAGELAEVFINGDDDTDLDLFVYDEYGNMVCSGVTYSDQEYCSWYPMRTGPYRIEVVNLGNIWNEYWIETY